MDTDNGHRNLKLLNDFGYVDSKGKTWEVPGGTIIEEASMPKSLWLQDSIPLLTSYRRAAILLTYYCKYRKENWFLVYRMFYDACLTAGLPERKAKALFAGVFASQQRWSPSYGYRSISDKTVSFLGYQLINVSIAEIDFNEILEWIETKNPSIDELVIRLHCSMKEKKEKRLLEPKDL
ncbi:DUF1353 domain-containing protein [Spirosoma aerolatum]|uniref:DUF1353 domain-containing protein n=1 Tax=Spirosoma aerolatum TaxID=1211326 RepID=UPI001473831E|nr:DUF1353 domain-containing protein [Spirosoma aerolatum]